ncbi:hypothetical protein RFI_04398 [Reticulomyxa filosa]|uniref:Uncharacterized protein n=1 Tax=Reticulomyxa filosa TaxID=46433 RepID=X6P3L4_RETFI|nr:hypothetical protein RFI_04398 [Reticulomyxa filosa]|eukprot:ETO32718.1 hypothetical protein RFI_04398 [Reticulomyxa filosa]
MKKDKKQRYFAEEIIYWWLKKMKMSAERQSITNVMIGIPDDFNDTQTRAVVDAARVAGFKEGLQLRRNSVASGYLYKLGEGYTCIIKWGGTMLYVALLQISGHSRELRESFRQQLGGRDLDVLLARYLVKDRHLKHQLTFQSQASVHIPLFTGGVDLTLAMTQKILEKVEPILLQISLEFVKSSVQRCQVSNVILSGGSCFIPKVKDIIAGIFPGKKIHNSVLPSQCIVRGCTKMIKE